MEDTPARPAPPPRPRPRNPASAQKRGGPPPSKESRFIGYLVLGFGVVAIVAVLMLATGGENTPEEKQNKAAQSLVTELNQSPAAPVPAPRKEFFFERQPRLDADDIKGSWQTAIGDSTVVVQIQDNVYQIIIAASDPNATRQYSSGTYKVLEDILVMTPRLDWPPPKSSSGARIRYAPLTTAPFPMLVALEGGKMLWQNPPPSEKRVAAPYRSPLIGDAAVDYITWKRMD